jgi:mono/diheme cytochrome c family protein
MILYQAARFIDSSSILAKAEKIATAPLPLCPPKIDLSVNEIAKVKSLYISFCQTCHGENMAGGSGRHTEKENW